MHLTYKFYTGNCHLNAPTHPKKNMYKSLLSVIAHFYQSQWAEDKGGASTAKTNHLKL